MVRKSGTVLVQVGFEPAEADILGTAATDAKRTLPAEIRERVRQTIAPGDATERAMADLMITIAQRVLVEAGIYADPQEDRAHTLGLMKDVIGRVLDGLGSKPNTDELPLAEAISWDILLKIKAGGRNEREEASTEERRLARVGKAFGYPKGDKGKGE